MPTYVCMYYAATDTAARAPAITKPHSILLAIETTILSVLKTPAVKRTVPLVSQIPSHDCSLRAADGRRREIYAQPEIGFVLLSFTKLHRGGERKRKKRGGVLQQFSQAIYIGLDSVPVVCIICSC